MSLLNNKKSQQKNNITGTFINKNEMFMNTHNY